VLTTKLNKTMPLGVKIIALLNLIFGFGFLATGIEFLFSQTLELSLTFIIISVPSLIVGTSFYKGKRWGWIFAIIFYSVGVIITIATIALGFTDRDAAIGVVISILIVAFLNMSYVKAYFSKEIMSREV
jgi:hypothetical protein